MVKTQGVSRKIYVIKYTKIWQKIFAKKSSAGQSAEVTTGGFLYKGVLRNFAKFIRKHLCQSLLFNKLAGLR